LSARQPKPERDRCSRRTRTKIFGPLAGKGSGPGEGGGTDKGKDKGVGRGEGDGKITARQKRVLRWVMLFNTQNGADYARQLHALGAILAFPNPRDANEYLVIRDLGARPITANVEDLSVINRIFEVDEKRQSVESVPALGIEPVPRTSSPSSRSAGAWNCCNWS
jgi:hypothetical protein